jgi:pyrophosphatase PpaX
MDATLINSRPVYDEAFDRTFREILNLEMSEQDRAGYMGLPTVDFLVQYGGGERVDELAARLKMHVEQLMHLAQLFPGIYDVLVRLKRAGLKIAVVTAQNRPESVLTRQVIGIDDLIDTWVISDDYSHPKPHPEPVQVALQRLSVAQKHALMVGDSVYDMRAGQGAGVAVAAACWGASQPDELRALAPDYILQSPDDLLSIVGV